MAMKRTLLELTQDILVSLDGDEVTSIADTSESASVAAIIRQNFYEIASEAKLPEHHSLFSLTETSIASPTIMMKPSDVMTIDWIKYDNQNLTDTNPDYREVYAILDFKAFQERQLSLDIDATDVASFNYVISGSSYPFIHTITRPPQYYTTYDDGTIVFDAYDITTELFLRKAKTMAYGLKESSWTHSDSAVPNLDHKLSNLLFQSSKAQAFSELKQIESASAERKTRRAKLTMLKEKADINDGGRQAYWDTSKLPNYGKR